MSTKIKANVKLEGEYNNMPGRVVVEELLNHALPNAWAPVDLPEKAYWQNERDTLVIEINGAEVWRMGEKATEDSLIAMAVFGKQCQPDEMDAIKVRGKTVIRFWWD